MSDIQNQNANEPTFSVRALGAGANSGAIAIEQERAIAEAQGQLILAKKFPRKIDDAETELMQACRLQSLASVAFYSVPRGQSVVTGPSIRLAEEIARVWGNMEYGHRELSRTEGKSEIEVYAWDKQTNTRSVRQLTVPHVLDTKSGPRKLRDQKDVDDLIANKASKQLRGRILAIVPKWLVEAAVQECKKTIAMLSSKEPIQERAKKMIAAFSRIGVTESHLQQWLGGKLPEKMDSDEFVELTGVYNAIRDGHKAEEFFGDKNDKPVNPDSAALQAAITQAASATKQQEPQVQQPAQESQAPQDDNSLF